MTSPGPAFQECTGSCHENVLALNAVSFDLRSTDGLTVLARIEIVAILVHYQPSYKTAARLCHFALHDVSCRQSWHLSTPSQWQLYFRHHLQGLYNIYFSHFISKMAKIHYSALRHLQWFSYEILVCVVHCKYIQCKCYLYIFAVWWLRLKNEIYLSLGSRLKMHFRLANLKKSIMKTRNIWKVIFDTIYA